eukprot:TRINITY_DN6245_c0_g1_i4.p1 TRINITY_DN6245_c0_g1~~TRINITY_DN6245_c0_g1_i4.p1  ORF type:complete len:721 (+),score=282.85 TRINITY_DN6245_c0_g1_i4:92-2254(+)
MGGPSPPRSRRSRSRDRDSSGSRGRERSNTQERERKERKKEKKEKKEGEKKEKKDRKRKREENVDGKTDAEIAAEKEAKKLAAQGGVWGGPPGAVGPGGVPIVQPQGQVGPGGGQLTIFTPGGAALIPQQQNQVVAVPDPNAWEGRHIHCPHCSVRLEIEYSMVPERMDCPKCKREFMAPACPKPAEVPQEVYTFSDLFIRILRAVGTKVEARPCGRGLHIIPHLAQLYMQFYGCVLRDDCVAAGYRNVLEALQDCPDLEMIYGNSAIRLIDETTADRYMTEDEKTRVYMQAARIQEQQARAAAHQAAIQERQAAAAARAPDQVPGMAAPETVRRQGVFVESKVWTGPKPGYYFGTTPVGTGYHNDPRAALPEKEELPEYELLGVSPPQKLVHDFKTEAPKPLQPVSPPQPKPGVTTIKLQLKREKAEDDWGFTLKSDRTVESIAADSPAWHFGLVEGFKVMMVDGEPLKKAADVLKGKEASLTLQLVLLEPPGGVKKKEEPAPEQNGKPPTDWTDLPPAPKEEKELDWTDLPPAAPLPDNAPPDEELEKIFGGEQKDGEGKDGDKDKKDKKEKKKQKKEEKKAEKAKAKAEGKEVPDTPEDKKKKKEEKKAAKKEAKKAAKEEKKDKKEETAAPEAASRKEARGDSSDRDRKPRERSRDRSRDRDQSRRRGRRSRSRSRDRDRRKRSKSRGRDRRDRSRSRDRARRDRSRSRDRDRRRA